jgi:hypothetical protein
VHREHTRADADDREPHVRTVVAHLAYRRTGRWFSSPNGVRDAGSARQHEAVYLDPQDGPESESLSVAVTARAIETATAPSCAGSGPICGARPVSWTALGISGVHVSRTTMRPCLMI